MSYSLNIEHKEDYLHVSVYGECTLANVLSYFEEVYGACILYRCSNVLIEQHLTGPNLDTFDIFVVVTKNHNSAKNIGLRLAFVDTHTKHDAQGLRFGENLAQIRGVNVRVFYTYEPHKMVEWLLSKEIKLV